MAQPHRRRDPASVRRWQPNQIWSRHGRRRRAPLRTTIPTARPSMRYPGRSAPATTPPPNMWSRRRSRPLSWNLRLKALFPSTMKQQTSVGALSLITESATAPGPRHGQVRTADINTSQHRHQADESRQQLPKGKGRMTPPRHLGCRRPVSHRPPSTASSGAAGELVLRLLP